MEHFSLFFKGFIIGISIYFICYIYNKFNSFIRENEKLNEYNDDLKEQINISNEIEKKTKNISDVDYANNSDRMRDGSL